MCRGRLLPSVRAILKGMALQKEEDHRVQQLHREEDPELQHTRAMPISLPKTLPNKIAEIAFRPQSQAFQG